MTGKRKWNVERLIDDESFVHWVKGTDPEARKYWENWIAENPEARDVVDKSRMIVEGVDLKPRYMTQREVDRKWEAMQQAVKDKNGGRNLPVTMLIKIAAGFLLLFLTAIYGHHLFWNTEVVYATDFGERKTVDLPDGSVAELNANSEIRFTRKSSRQVHMKGEVFFEVRKDEKNGSLFEVYTPDLDIQVLGTAFNVNTRQEKTRILLERGGVQLKIKEYGDVVMYPGELVTYSSVNNEITKEKNVATEKYTSWKKGILVLDNATVREALDMLGDTYGVEVVYQDTTLMERTMKGGIPSDDLELSLNTLRKIYGINIEYNENKLIIR